MPTLKREFNPEGFVHDSRGKKQKVYLGKVRSLMFLEEGVETDKKQERAREARLKGFHGMEGV